ncbi:MAG: putative sugar nucleotidyl transferase [Planctomycetota bacterium]
MILFEDDRVADLRPANLVQPTMALRAGAVSALDAVRALGWPVHVVVRDYLRESVQERMEMAALSGGPRLFVNARMVPDLARVSALRALAEQGRAMRWIRDGACTAACVPADVPLPDELTPRTVTQLLHELDAPSDGGELELLHYPHDLVRAHMEVFPRNLECLIEHGGFSAVTKGVYAKEGAEVAASAVLDPANGPVVLEEGVRIADCAYVSGPAYIGRDTRLIDHAAVKDGVALAHVCKVGGEVECSTFMPYANKQHHGFIGHAFIGSWVNMGAGTSNSDLKNTYGEVRVEHGGQRLDTGMQFLGCVIGDFSKTAINTSIFTGKFIGVASMIYGFVTRNVPSFCNWARSFGEVTECPPEVVAATQKRMFARRGIEQTEADLRLLRRAFELTKEERLMTSEPPQL